MTEKEQVSSKNSTEDTAGVAAGITAGGSHLALHAVVAADRRDVGVELRVEVVQRVGAEEVRQQRARVVEKVLHWVHGEAAPRPRVVAFMVQGVHPAVEERADVALREPVLAVPPSVQSGDLAAEFTTRS